MVRLRCTSKANSSLVCLIIFLNCLTLKAQQNPILIDEIIAVVGKNAIFKSDIDASVAQLQTQGAPTNFSTSCYVLEERLFEK